jgi:hypothetical protein
MKLIIDISEEDYKWVCEQNMGFELYKMIANGTPLAESDDCVSRQAVKEQMIKYGFHAPDMTVTEFVEDILNLPSVQPNRDKGKWYIYQDYWYECSKCGCLRYMPTFTENYCPNCGADMKG